MLEQYVLFLYICVCLMCAQSRFIKRTTVSTVAHSSLQILRALTHNLSEPKQHVLWEVASFSLLDPASEMNSQPFLCEQMSAASALKVRWKWQSVPPSVCETDLTAAVKHSCCCCCCCVGGFTAPECGFFIFFLVDLVVVQIILKRLKGCGLFYFSLPTSQVACHTSHLLFSSRVQFVLFIVCVDVPREFIGHQKHYPLHCKTKSLSSAPSSTNNICHKNISFLKHKSYFLQNHPTTRSYLK